jgi:NDP-sugar pyrophosphorylase family protein
MINVDTLLNPDIYEMSEFHKKQGTLATVLLSTVADTKNFGVAKMRGSMVVQFAEKPKTSTSNIINAGMCIFKPHVSDYVTRQKFMIEELFRKLAKEKQLSGYVYDGIVLDVGTREGYEKAISLMKGKK